MQGSQVSMSLSSLVARPRPNQRVLLRAPGTKTRRTMNGQWAMAHSQGAPGAQPYGQYEEEYQESWAQRKTKSLPFTYTQPWMLPPVPLPGFVPMWPQFNCQQQVGQQGSFLLLSLPTLTNPAVAQQQQQQARPYSTTTNMDRKAPGTLKKPKAFPKKPSSPGRAAVTPPSAESGGIPDPTPAYLLRASFLPRTLPSPRHMLVIIDLNGTLLFRPSRKAPGASISRPHAGDFLAYCTSTFHVMIWSSARADNVRKLVDSLLTPAQQKRVVAVWGRESFGLSKEDFSLRAMCYKRLSKVWSDDEIARRHPKFDQGERWDQGNTVLVDDTLEKARSEPHNAVQLPEFGGNVNEEPAVLPQVHDFLNVLACQADISTYIRANPFRAVMNPSVEPANAVASMTG